MVNMIKKVIIPVAWMWTRFLPATKASPKEMLPLVDKPVIQYIVEEAVNSWIEEVIFVTWREKRSIEDHFDSSSELNSILEKRWKNNILAEIKKLENLAKIAYVRQATPLWDWHAILCAKHCISEWEDFAVLFWDDIIDHSVPALAQLMDLYKEKKKCIIWVKEIDGQEIENYWVVSPGERNANSVLASWFVEKPSFNDAPSNLWIIWKYVCTYDIFDAIEKWNPSNWWELRLIDWFIHLLGSSEIYAKILEWTRYDTWSKIWWIKANIAYALKRDDLRKELMEYLQIVSKG